jgi:multiple sugar transport system permease protein
MNAITKRDPTAVQASEDVVAIHRRMLRRQRFNRILAYVIGILIVLWILVPVFFIASMAFTTPESVRAYPKGVLPFIPLSMDTMNFFLSSEGVIPGITNSIIVSI